MTPDNGAEVHDPVLAEVLAWQRQGTELRAKLLAEKEALLKRLGEIDTALAMVPGPQHAVSQQAESSERADDRDSSPRSTPIRLPMSAVAFRKLSMPQKVQAIVKDHQDGITAADVVDVIRLAVTDVDAALVHSGLSRSVGSRAIRGEGTRGARIYYPCERSTEVDVDE